MAWPPDRRIWLLVALLAGVAGVAGQLLPVAHLSAESGGARASVEAKAWQATFRSEGFGTESAETRSWYDGRFDDQEGIDRLRWAAPTLAAGLLLGLAALLLVAARMDRWASGAALLAFVATGSGTLLEAMGLMVFYDEQQAWDLGLWLMAASAAGYLLVAWWAFVRPPPRMALDFPGAPPL